MPTKMVTLTRTPQLVCDGTSNFSVNTKGASVYFAESEDQPTDLTVHDELTGRLGFGPNVMIWMWVDTDYGPTIPVISWYE
ncbi:MULTISPECIES: hypothetical protein [unclassified Pantoea]|uniref:hypothetical protein n=1 Tax=unclassified Pantoea TaxID=2630326 RepID=UPI00206BB2EA|nr:MULTISPECIES: hypothetical protein [unclassified Pantoea]MDU5474006.1 hypothetical protein [Pantoea sp.]DAI70392.1 MAG TPA: hypothetical protein [Bacteriophage sp.]